ncbi:keratinocyte-associated transmembrane protein 2 [Menidia menidia]
MATCGSTGQSKRPIYTFCLVVFIQLLFNGCFSAPLNETTKGTENVTQSLTTLSQGTGGMDNASAEQSETTKKAPPTLLAGNESTAAKATDNNASAGTPPKESPESVKTDSITVIASSADIPPKDPAVNDTIKAPSGKTSGDPAPSQVPPAQASSNCSTAAPATTAAPAAPLKTDKPATAEPKVTDPGPKNPNTPSPLAAQSTESDPPQTTDQRSDGDVSYYGDDEDTYMSNDDIDGKPERTDEGFDQVEDKQRVEEMEVTRYKGADVYNSEDEDSHFFFHLIILAFLVAIVYITYHNKRKILLLVQSKRWKDGLCSHNTVEYHRLDQNVHEAMPSLKMTRDYIF